MTLETPPLDLTPAEYIFLSEVLTDKIKLLRTDKDASERVKERLKVARSVLSKVSTALADISVKS
jgi:hypothetical protein